MSNEVFAINWTSEKLDYEYYQEALPLFDVCQVIFFILFNTTRYAAGFSQN
jgi:hypothetical protein